VQVDADGKAGDVLSNGMAVQPCEILLVAGEDEVGAEAEAQVDVVARHGPGVPRVGGAGPSRRDDRDVEGPRRAQRGEAADPAVGVDEVGAVDSPELLEVLHQRRSESERLGQVVRAGVEQIRRRRLEVYPHVRIG
jgi:hypothetical protein